MTRIMQQASHIIRRNLSLVCLLSLVILLVPAIQPLLTLDFTCGYDNAFHLWRAVEVEHLLRQGILFSRWAPDMALGFGFPLFVFVSPASAYVAVLFRLVGLPWPLAVNATFALGIVLGGLFMFFLARDLFGPHAGLVAAVAYVYAPYQAYEVFNRGSLWEAFAWAFPPLVLWATQRWTVHSDRRFFAVGVLGLAGLILIHQLFAFLFAPLLVGWVLLASFLARDRRVIGRGAGMGLLALGLSAFFWLPGLAERDWVQTGRLLGTWVFDYHDNFLDLRQLLAPPRVVDTTLINDWPPRALGLLPLLVTLLPLARWRRMSRAARWQVTLLLVLTAGFAFMTLPPSLPLWEHVPLLPYVQFPWRFLGPAAFSAAILAGAAVSPYSPRPATHQSPITNLHSPFSIRHLLFAILIIPLIILGNLGWFYPRHCPPPRNISVAGMIAWERVTDTLGTTAKGEYLPAWVHQVPTESALDAAYTAGSPIVRLPPESLPAGTRLFRADYGPLTGTVELDTPVPFKARYLAFYYPGWQVTVDGNLVSIAPAEPDGLVTFDVPAGRHTIRVRFGETLTRLAADVVSLLSLLAVVVLTIRHSPFAIRHSPFAIRHSPFAIRHSPFAIVILLVTLSFLTVFSLNLSPYLRGPEEWRWVYAIPSRPDRLWIPALALALYLALTFIWIRQAARRRRRWIFLLVLVLAAPLVQASLLSAEHHDFLKTLFYRTVSAGSSGVFSVGSTIEDAGDFLRRYPALMPTFPVHPQRYPPGLPFLFYLARRLLEKMPALADALGFRLRLYQCHDPSLMRLSNATISTAGFQMALPLVSALTLLPLYGLARRAYGWRAAAWAVALYPLAPSFALWSGRWEQLYPLLACAAWYFFYVGLTSSRRFALFASGLTLSFASLLNFSVLTLLLPMGLFALFWLLAHPDRYRHHWAGALADTLVFLIGLASFWIIYQWAFGAGFFDVWRVSMSYHLGLGRSYWTWLGYHLYDFFTFLGLPLALLFLVALAKGLCDLRRRRYDTLALGCALGLLLLDLSGTARGEVARVWLFLTPFAVLAAARGLARLRLRQSSNAGFVLVACLLALQLFTFNTFLRVVTTGLTDPPSRTRTFAPPPLAHSLGARFGDSIALLGYDLSPDMPVAGDPLHLTLYWQSLRPMTQSYTVFTHLIDPDSHLAGQQDNVPLRSTAPTTCWVPGEIIADPYDVPINSQTPPGNYTLETGLYLWETGERLPAAGPTTTPDRRVVLTQVLVKKR